MVQRSWITNVSPYFVRLERLCNVGTLLVGLGVIVCFIPFDIIRLPLLLGIFLAIIYLPQTNKKLFGELNDEDIFTKLLINRNLPKEEKELIIKSFHQPEAQLPFHILFALKMLFGNIFMSLVIIAGGMSAYFIYILKNVFMVTQENSVTVLAYFFIVSLTCSFISITILLWRFSSDYRLFPISPYNILMNNDLDRIDKGWRWFRSLFFFSILLLMSWVTLFLIYGGVSVEKARYIIWIEGIIGLSEERDAVTSLKFWGGFLVLHYLGANVFMACTFKIIIDYIKCILYFLNIKRN